MTVHTFSSRSLYSRSRWPKHYVTILHPLRRTPAIHFVALSTETSTRRASSCACDRGRGKLEITPVALRYVNATTQANVRKQKKRGARKGKERESKKGTNVRKQQQSYRRGVHTAVSYRAMLRKERCTPMSFAVPQAVRTTAVRLALVYTLSPTRVAAVLQILQAGSSST